MAVTSDQLLAVVKMFAETQVNLDANGEVVFTVQPSLNGDALASSLKHVTDLAAHESGIRFAQQQWEDQRPAPAVTGYSGPRPVN